VVTSTHRARRRDRRVYLTSHPIIFALLCATRGRGVTRLGGTVIVHGTDAFLQALTQLPLDRTAQGTVGGLARGFVGDGVLFDQDGSAHRELRRSLADKLSAAGVERLRPAWRAVIASHLAALGAGEDVDMTEVAAEVAGVTVRALLGLDAVGSGTGPLEIARAARRVAAAAVRDNLPGLRRRRPEALAAAAADLMGLLEIGQPGIAGIGAMLAVAAVNTTVAGIPRAVAWCADNEMWPDAASESRRDVLTCELLRVTAPAALLHRVAAAGGMLTGADCARRACAGRVSAGDRLVLVARHAADAHSAGPDCDQPAPQRVAQLVFGAGPHACPGAALARAQLCDTLDLLAPYRPVVVRALADRHSALPGWKSLVIRSEDACARPG
jgi:cytochrome P450